MGGTYTEVNGYQIPNLVLSPEDHNPIGIWGQRHKRYLKEHRKATYTAMLTAGTLSTYLAGIDSQAEEMFSRLVKEMAERQGITEKLKAANQMLWAQKMNCIRNQVTEIVNVELIFA